MTATAHALIGGAIASSVNNPALGLTLAALSHPLADMIPHWDFGQGWKAKNKYHLFVQSILDLGLGIVLAYVFFGQNVDLIYFFAAIFMSEVWDILMMPYLLFGWKFLPFSAFYRVQHAINKKASLPWGILNQIGAIFLLVIVLKLIF